MGQYAIAINDHGGFVFDPAHDRAAMLSLRIVAQ